MLLIALLFLFVIGDVIHVALTGRGEGVQWTMPSFPKRPDYTHDKQKELERVDVTSHHILSICINWKNSEDIKQFIYLASLSAECGTQLDGVDALIALNSLSLLCPKSGNGKLNTDIKLKLFRANVLFTLLYESSKRKVAATVLKYSKLSSTLVCAVSLVYFCLKQ